MLLLFQKRRQGRCVYSRSNIHPSTLHGNKGAPMTNCTLTHPIHPSRPDSPQLLNQLKLAAAPTSMERRSTLILEESPPRKSKLLSSLFFTSEPRIRGGNEEGNPGKTTRLQVLPASFIQAPAARRRPPHLLEGSPSTASGTVLAMVRYLSAYSISRYRRVSRLSRFDTYFQNPYTPVRVISLSE
jgi:hypothetical protein